MNTTNVNICLAPEPNTTIIIQDYQRYQSSAFALGVINSILAVPTSISNLLVIIAIFMNPELKNPSYCLLTSLAFCDLAMGLVCQPLYSLTGFSYYSRNFESLCYSHFLSSSLSIIITSGSGLTITAISVDRYLAIFLKLRYRSTVTLPRVRCLLVSLWMVVFFMTSLLFYSPHNLIGLIALFYFLICLITIVFCYTKSFRALRVYCNQIQPQGSQQENNTSPNAIDLLKYRKLLNTMVLILVTTVLCYLPLSVNYIIISRKRKLEGVVSYSMLSIVGIHSLLNPIVYLVRMRDIRLACIRVLKRLPWCKV